MSDGNLFGRPIIVTNSTHRFVVIEQLNEIGIEADVLLESMRRQTRGLRSLPERFLPRIASTSVL